MIYLFTWNSEFLVKEAVKNWKQLFASKYWDFNLLHIKNFDTIDENFLVSNITTSSFFSEKKLVIIDIESKNDKSDEADNQKENEKEELLLKLLEKIPEENIILINIVNPDKRKKFFKTLSHLAEVKEYNSKDDEIQWYILKKYEWKITRAAIDTLILYKSRNISKIVSEIEKLLISYDYIDKKEIVEHIIPELEESIFQVVDDLLNLHINNAVKKIEIILNDTNIYAFYNNLIANLRTNTYIFHLKKLWKNAPEISQILDLWNKAFLVSKNYKITHKQLKNLYINLVNLDKKMKLWKLIWTEDSDLKLEIENCFLKIMQS